jgi:hypothetical protein
MFTLTITIISLISASIKPTINITQSTFITIFRRFTIQQIPILTISILY